MYKVKRFSKKLVSESINKTDDIARALGFESKGAFKNELRNSKKLDVGIFKYINRKKSFSENNPNSSSTINNISAGTVALGAGAAIGGNMYYNKGVNQLSKSTIKTAGGLDNASRKIHNAYGFNTKFDTLSKTDKKYLVNEYVKNGIIGGKDKNAVEAINKAGGRNASILKNTKLANTVKKAGYVGLAAGALAYGANKLMNRNNK